MHRNKILLLFFSSLLALLSLEITVSLLDLDDREKIQRVYDKYMKIYYSRSTHISVNKYLGWIHQGTSHPLLKFDTNGIRSDGEKKYKRGKEQIRIALFGDSFTLGDGVNFQESWGYILGRQLNCEVLNFGVQGYDMTQAYLRWKHDGLAFDPDIVIFGLQPENIRRNVNIIRVLYHGNTPVFSKPRFVNKKLINYPTIELDRLSEYVHNPSTYPLIKHEYWFLGNNFRFISFIKKRIKNTGFKKHHIDLAFNIITRFKEDVERKGKKFYVVYLPNYFQCDALANLVNAIRVGYISPHVGHYSQKENKQVAEAITKYLREQNIFT